RTAKKNTVADGGLEKPRPKERRFSIADPPVGEAALPFESAAAREGRSAIENRRSLSMLSRLRDFLNRSKASPSHCNETRRGAGEKQDEHRSREGREHHRGEH